MEAKFKKNLLFNFSCVIVNLLEFRPEITYCRGLDFDDVTLYNM